MHPKADIKKISRTLLPTDYTVTDWNGLEPYFKELSERTITSKAELEAWLTHLSELEAVVSEDACWRQIKMTCDTTDKSLEEAFTYFCMEIQPKLQQYADTLNKKTENFQIPAELEQTT